jgi:hypothetical protein
MLPFDAIEQGGSDDVTISSSTGQLAARRSSKRRTMKSQTKSLIRNARGIAQRRKQRRKLQQAGKTHPDDNKPLVISPHLRRANNWHRGGYIVVLLLVAAVTLTTPYTYHRSQHAKEETASAKTTLMVLAAVCVLTMLTIQGSDPGLIDVRK